MGFIQPFVCVTAVVFVYPLMDRAWTNSKRAVSAPFRFPRQGAHNACSAWAGNNVEGSYKRSVSLGLIISVYVSRPKNTRAGGLTGVSFCRGNIQGAVSSNVYRANQTPWYPLGHGLVLMYICIGLTASVAIRFLLKAENARRERGERDEVIDGYDGGLEVNGRFGSVGEAKAEKGDLWSGYRYGL